MKERGSVPGAFERMTSVAAVVWDFDGVLNRNVVDGELLWSKRITDDLGIDLDTFRAHLFQSNWHDVLTGREDLLDRLAAWAAAAGYRQPVQTVLDYWFAHDALPDRTALDLLAAARARGLRAVIATNNEPRRAAYIENEMGFAGRVERVFASGRIGVTKPDRRFFAHVSDALALAPERLLLIDDGEANVAAARRCGWRAHHFTAGGYDALARLLATC